MFQAVDDVRMFSYFITRRNKVSVRLAQLENSGNFKMFHKFLMKYSDIAPKTRQNDTQLVMFSTKFHRVRAFYMEIQKEGPQNFESTARNKNQHEFAASEKHCNQITFPSIFSNKV